MEIFVQSDVVHIGRSFEDGEPVEGIYFYVMARAPDGSQWIYAEGRLNRTLHWDDEAGIDYVEYHDDAEVFCYRLAAGIREHLATGGKLDLDKDWWETDPAYGSEAYQDLDRTGYFRAMEIRDAEDRGEIAVGSVPYFSY